ncbi:MAG TPA: hypothetical protein VKR52_08190 [Terracidiphilus sp.]|nr:hypothetical protein [Terracidiphilus sp.]
MIFPVPCQEGGCSTDEHPTSLELIEELTPGGMNGMVVPRAL